jgi:hypothetical protein
MQTAAGTNTTRNDYFLSRVRTWRGRPARRPRAARLAKWIPASPLRLPRMEAASGRANASRFFDMHKGASLRVARSDWTAARASLQNGCLA